MADSGGVLRFNMNRHVKVKFRPAAIEILRERFYRLVKPYAPELSFKEPEVDENGYSRYQLWQLMSDFGHAIGNGIEPVFELEILFDMGDFEDDT